jgi:uncharacterized membrane protein YdjX (TVP38/TMEM64 family)
MPFKKLALAFLIAGIIGLYFLGGGEKYLDIHFYQALFEQSPISTAAVFFFVFVIGTSCSLPVTGALAVAAGIVFGAVPGFIIASCATTLGGTVALYSSRFIFYDLVKRRFTAQVDVINKGIEKEGAFYLFGLRMIPIIPFWSLNLLMGLTSMRVPVFMLATLFGMIPVLLILTYTGSELGDIDNISLSAVFTPGLLLSMALLASFPFIAKAIVGFLRRYTNNEAN